MGAHLKHALHHYIRCLQKAPAAADGMRARAAAAACRLWLNHPKDAALSTSLSELLRGAAGARGELPPEFVAYVPQLTSRLGSDEACDEFAAALHRLLEGAAASAGGAQAVGFELCALRRDETEPARAAAAEKLFARLRSRAPALLRRARSRRLELPPPRPRRRRRPPPLPPPPTARARRPPPRRRRPAAAAAGSAATVFPIAERLSGGRRHDDGDPSTDLSRVHAHKHLELGHLRVATAATAPAMHSASQTTAPSSLGGGVRRGWAARRRASRCSSRAKT